MVQRFPRYFFFAFVFLLPIQTVWLWRVPIIEGAKWQYGTIGLYGTDVVLLLFFSVWLVGMFRASRKSFFSSCISFHSNRTSKKGHSVIPEQQSGRGIVWFDIPDALLFLMLFLAGLSVMWAHDPFLAAYTFGNLLFAYGVFRMARSLSVRERYVVISLLVIGALLESLLGIWQFLSQSSFASSLLGMSGYEPWRAGVSVLKNESGRWLRAYGTFPHPNIFGASVGTALVLLCSLVAIPGVRSQRDTAQQRRARHCGRVWDIRKMNPSLVWAGVTVSVSVLVLGLILSFSRTAWVGTVIGLCVLGLAVFLRGTLGMRRRFVKTVGAILIAACVFAGVFHEVVFPRFESSVIESEGSVVDRVALLRQAGSIIRQHPLLGVGVGNYTLAAMNQYPDIFVWDVQPVHDVFVLAFAELGIVGGVAFVGFCVAIVFVASRNLFSLTGGPGMGAESVAAFPAFLALVPSLFLDHFLWDSHFGLLFFFLLVGLVIHYGDSVE